MINMENNEFKYKKLLEIRKMSIEELSSYYRRLRSYEYDINKPLDTSSIKKRVYFLTKIVLKIDRILSGRKLIIYDDKRLNNSSLGKVYASSHVGRYDIESAMEAINEQAYFVMGDPEETNKNLEGFFLDNFCGRICFDTGYQVYDLYKKHREGIPLSKEEQALYDEFKKDRHIGEETATRRIANKDNILIYPEGAWNITPRLTQSLFRGTARIAVNGNGIIVPIGIVRDKKRYTVNVGKEMDIQGASLFDVEDITSELKERMNSLVGEIIFSGDKITPRSSFKSPEENERDFIDSIMSESANGYTEDVIEKTRYEDPNYPENVYKKIKRL